MLSVIESLQIATSAVCFYETADFLMKGCLLRVANGFFGAGLPTICTLMAERGADNGFFIFTNNYDRIGGTNLFAKLTSDAGGFIHRFMPPRKPTKQLLGRSKGANQIVKHGRSVSNGKKDCNCQPDKQNRQINLKESKRHCISLLTSI